MKPFQPGQKLICHLQKRPINDFGSLSYLARNLQFAHGFSLVAIVCRFVVDLLFVVCLLFPPVFDAFHPFDAQDGQAAILKRLGQSEEYEPEHPFGGSADG